MNKRAAFSEGERIEIDLAEGVLTNLTRLQKTPFLAYPSFLCAIMAAGGWLPYAGLNLTDRQAP